MSCLYLNCLVFLSHWLFKIKVTNTITIFTIFFIFRADVAYFTFLYIYKSLAMILTPTFSLLEDVNLLFFLWPSLFLCFLCFTIIIWVIGIYLSYDFWGSYLILLLIYFLSSFLYYVFYSFLKEKNKNLHLNRHLYHINSA